MELTLKNKHIYLPSYNNVLTKTDSISIKVLDKYDLKGSTMTAYINGRVLTFNQTFNIPEGSLDSKYFDLKIVIVASDGKQYEYISDTQPITRAIILGAPCKEWYPSIIDSMSERLKKLEQRADSLEEKQTECNINVTLALQGINEINNKGEVL